MFFFLPLNPLWKHYPTNTNTERNLKTQICLNLSPSRQSSENYFSALVDIKRPFNINTYSFPEHVTVL